MRLLNIIIRTTLDFPRLLVELRIIAIKTTEITIYGWRLSVPSLAEYEHNISPLEILVLRLDLLLP